MSAERETRVIPDPESQVLDAPTPSSDTREPRPLHYVKRGAWPLALCGAVVADAWNPNRTDTAGRDRCPACFRVLQQLREGVN